ncbi:MAG: hypothetical protein J5654_09620 [Victivallales bacterium]|nr:hypothetical protein [Victivallales bacterium]
MSKLVCNTSKAYNGTKELHSVRTEISDPEKSMLEIILKEAEPLPYELKELEMSDGTIEQEYDIPECDKASVLNDLYPFDPCPKLDEELFDLHEQKAFAVRDYRVIRCRKRNMVVSPYYPHSGGMVVDWMPTEDTASSSVVVKFSK